MTSLEGNVCPKVLFTGRPLEFKKEFRLAFGDYVEAYDQYNDREEYSMYRLVSGQ
jgi:hypothetical protein